MERGMSHEKTIHTYIDACIQYSSCGLIAVALPDGKRVIMKIYGELVPTTVRVRVRVGVSAHSLL